MILAPQIRRNLLLGAAIIATCAFDVSCGGGGGGGSPTAPPVPPGVVTVQITDNAFSPRSVTVEPGDTVRWVMQGAAAGHTVTDNTGAFDSGQVFNAAGDSFSRTFGAADAGRTFEYRCATHQACCQMQGSVRVGTNAPPPGPGY